MISYNLHSPPLVRLGILMILGVLIAVFFGGAVAASAAPLPTSVTQCNGLDNTGGLEINCDVTVVNNLDLASGVTSTTVTVKECHGAANAAPLCTTTTQSATPLTTAVDQCNGSGNGGGGVVECHVQIQNIVTGAGTSADATVNQCSGSGTGGGTEPTIICDPMETTTNATITQCNSSGTGGGGTERVLCDVGTSTQSAELPVTVNQCIGSGNGGGGYVTCSVRLANTFLPAAVVPVPTDSPTPGTPTDTPTPGTPTDTPTPGSPETPATPGTPIIPETPTTPPTTPSVPGTPETPKTPGTDVPMLPSTGANIWPMLLLSLGLTGAGAALMVIRGRQGRTE